MYPIQQAGTVRNRGNLRNFGSVDLPMHQGCDVSFRQLRTCLPDWLGSFVPIGDLSRCSKVRGQNYRYSMTSSASNCIELGTSMPSALAVCRLMTNSNFVDCTTGRSAGFSPLRIRPT